MPSASPLLASDLDGTLIPPPGPPDPHTDPSVFARSLDSRRLRLAYVTGRHYALALQGIAGARLPMPDWLVCDVGTSLFRRVHDGRFVREQDFGRTLKDALGADSMAGVEAALAGVPGLEAQEAEKQADLKRSYYVEPGRLADVLEVVRRRLEATGLGTQLVDSLDPVTGRGLLDVLPRGSGKARALEALAAAGSFGRDDITFAGDSGNDRDALLSGHQGIVVGNADGGLKRELAREAARRDLSDRVYFAREPYAAGVIEGCRHFGLL